MALTATRRPTSSETSASQTCGNHQFEGTLSNPHQAAASPILPDRAASPLLLPAHHTGESLVLQTCVPRHRLVAIGEELCDQAGIAGRGDGACLERVTDKLFKLRVSLP